MSRQMTYEGVITVPPAGLVPPSGKHEIIPPGMENRIDAILIPEECIRHRVGTLARQICQDHAGAKELNLVVVLNGAFVFASDLGREVHRHGGPEVKYGFIKSRAYGKEIKKTGETGREVTIELEPGDIEGKDVLLVEDIVDQRFTLSEISRYLRERSVSSLKICTLLNKVLQKPSRKVEELSDSVALDYVGFEIPDRWIAGYGIDAGEDFRHLPFVVTVREDFYLHKR